MAKTATSKGYAYLADPTNSIGYLTRIAFRGKNRNVAEITALFSAKVPDWDEEEEAWSNWTVTKQSTAAGAQMSTDTLIVLTCTKKT